MERRGGEGWKFARKGLSFGLFFDGRKNGISINVWIKGRRRRRRRETHRVDRNATFEFRDCGC